MGRIVLYKPDETDFTGNGICGLNPIEAVVTEVSAGAYELTMVHPIDADGKWQLVKEEYLLKASVPENYTPEIIMPAAVIWKVKSSVSTTPLYSKLPTYTKAKTPVDDIVSNASSFIYRFDKQYYQGDYVVWQGAIYIARLDNAGGNYPGYSDAWEYVIAVNTTGGESSSSTIYDPGVIVEKIAGGEIISKLADYNKTYMRVTTLRGTSGYIKRADCEQTGDTAQPVVIPSRHITTQVFRIYKVTADSEDNTITVSARHYSYDFLGNSLYNCQLVSADPATAIAILQGSLMNDDSRTIACNITNASITGDWSWQNPIYALLDPDSGLAPNIGAKVIRDNADFFLLSNDNNDTGIEIAYGKNLLGVTWDWSTENVITRIVPRGTNKDGDDLYLPEMWIDSPLISNYPTIRVAIMDCDCTVGAEQEKADGTKTKLTEADCFAIMRQEAQKQFDVAGVDKVETQLQINFLLLGDTEEYAQYKGVQRVNLYDMIHIVHGPLGLDATVQVTEYEWDSVSDRYISITLGNAFASTQKTVAGYQIASGALTTRMFANGAIGSSALSSDIITARNIKAEAITTELLAAEAVTAGQIAAESITSVKIASQAITTEKLAAGAVTAETINAQAVTAEKIAANAVTSEKIAAGAITANKIDANDIDAFNAKLGTANIARAAVETADINFLRVKDLNAQSAYFQQAVMTEGVGGEIFISRLRVAYAQMVAATIGDLVIKASDDNYYQIDVNADGTVTGTQVQVSQEEIESGHTTGGRTIIESDIVAENLSTSNIYATHALIGEITANTINVDSLFAREATIDKINTMDLMSNTYIRLAVGDRTGHTDSLTDEVAQNQAQILLNNNAITQEVNRATAAEGGLIAKTETYQTADSIVNAAKSYADGQLESYSTKTQTASQIAEYVTNNAYKQVSGISITSPGIEITGSQYVKIGSAGKLIVEAGNFQIDANGNVELTGKVTATSGAIGGWKAGATNLSSGSGTTYVALDSDSNSTYAIWAGNSASTSAPFRVGRDGSVYMTTLYSVSEDGTRTVNLSNKLWKLDTNCIRSYTQADGYCSTITLTNGAVLNFKKAAAAVDHLVFSAVGSQPTQSGSIWTSTIDVEGVDDSDAIVWTFEDQQVNVTGLYNNAYGAGQDSVTLSGAWSGATYTATTSTNKTASTTITGVSLNGVAKRGSGTADLTQGVIVKAGNTNVLSTNITVDGTLRYNDGWTAARGKVTLPGAGTGTSFSVKVPSATVGNQDTATFTIAASSSTPSASGYANVRYGGNVVGRVNIGGWYSSGVTAGQNAVTVSGAWSGATYTATTSTNKTASTTITGVSLNGVAKRGSGTKALTQSVIVKAGSTNVLTTNITVDGSLRYADGETAGKAAIGISGSWSGTKFTATTVGKATESTVATTLSSSGSWGTGGNVNKYTLSVKATNPSGGSSTPLTATVDATGRYNAGVTYGKNTYGFVNNCTAYANYYSSDWLTLYVRVQATTPAGGDTGWDQDIGVDASGAYWAGYDAGWYNARAMMTRDGNVIYGPPASRDGDAVEMYRVTVDVKLRDVSVARTEADATAYVNGTGVAWQTRRIIHST